MTLIENRKYKWVMYKWWFFFRMFLYALFTLNFSKSTFIKFCVRETKKSPDRYYPHSLLGMAYGWSKKYLLAINEYKTLLDLGYDNINVIMGLAYNYYEAGLFEHAEKQFKQVIKKKPDNKDALEYLARISVQKRDVLKAINYVIEKTKNSDNDPIAYQQLAYCYFQIGDLKNALDYYKKSLKFLPEQNEVRNYIEFIERELKRRGD